MAVEDNPLFPMKEDIQPSPNQKKVDEEEFKRIEEKIEAGELEGHETSGREGRVLPFFFKPNFPPVFTHFFEVPAVLADHDHHLDHHQLHRHLLHWLHLLHPGWIHQLPVWKVEYVAPIGSVFCTNFLQLVTFMIYYGSSTHQGTNQEDISLQLIKKKTCEVQNTKSHFTIYF